MSRSTETKNILKQLALDAKERLKRGNYNSQAENNKVKRKLALENHLRLIAGSECKKPEITIKIINDFSEEEKFEKRVIQLLTEHEDCVNPLKRLADEKYFNSLSDSEQERYILDLSDKFKTVKENYYKQKTSTFY